MQINAKMVSELREQTGAGMMECKKALTEADGDIEKARDILRARGKAGVEKRAGRAAADGLVATAVSEKGVALVELNSETDFVARNEEFRSLANELAELAAKTGITETTALLEQTLPDGETAGRRLDDVLTKLRENIIFRRIAFYPNESDNVIASYIHKVTNKIGVLVVLKGDPANQAQVDIARDIAMHVAANKPEFASSMDIPASVVEREKAVLAEKTRNEGKPEASIAKIVEGRIGKYFEQVCLLEQPFVKDPSKKVHQLISEAGAEFKSFSLFVVGQE